MFSTKYFDSILGIFVVVEVCARESAVKTSCFVVFC
jgi:hypothetical protein